MPDVQKQSWYDEIQESDAEELQAASLCETRVHAMRGSRDREEGDNYHTSCSSTVTYSRWICLRTCFPEPNKKQTLAMDWLRLRIFPSPKGTQVGSCSGMRGNKGSWRRSFRCTRRMDSVSCVLQYVSWSICLSHFELHASMYKSSTTRFVFHVRLRVLLHGRMMFHPSKQDVLEECRFKLLIKTYR